MRIFLFAFLVDGVFGDTESVMEGHSAILHTNITKNHQDRMLWYFEGTRIALINGEASKSCLYDGEGGRFRDRLEVDYETGSLNITNIKPEHAGRYEAEIIRSESSGKTESLNRSSKCESARIYPKSSKRGEIIKSFSLTVIASDSGEHKNKALTDPQDKEMEKTVPGSGPSTGVVAGIVVGVVVVGVVLLMMAAAVVFRKKIDDYIFRKFKEIPTSERTTV